MGGKIKMKPDKKKLIIGLCLLSCTIIWSGEKLVEKISLQQSEKIFYLLMSQNGAGYAVRSSTAWDKHYLRFKGQTFGPYNSILEEALSDDGTAMTFRYDAGVLGPSYVYANGATLGPYQSIEALHFISGTTDVTYRFTETWETWNEYIAGRVLGLYGWAGWPIFSENRQNFFYKAQIAGNKDGFWYIYQNGEKSFGPFKIIDENNYRYLPDSNDIMFLAQNTDDTFSIYRSQKEIIRKDSVTFLLYNDKIGSIAYSYKENNEYYAYDGKKTFGPFEKWVTAIAYSPDYSTFGFAVKTPDDSIDVYINGEKKYSVNSFYRFYFSNDGSTVAFPAMHKRKIKVFWNDKTFGDYQELLLNIVYAPDGKNIAYKAKRDDQYFICLSTGKEFGPYSFCTEPVFTTDSNSVFFYYINGDEVYMAEYPM